MKERRTTRLAVLMMALALITSCLAVGTLSKYTVGGNGADNARVAKWGVVLDVEASDAFDASYTGTGNEITVNADNGDNLVAPGTTKGEIKFSITGKPEVATKVTVSLGATKDVFLKYDSDNDGTKDATYYPVVFTLKHTYATGANPIAPAVEGTGATVTTNGNTETVTGTLEEINKVLANLQTAMTQVAPNYVYNDTFVLSWAWDFEAGNDNLDTILGDIAANVYANGYAKNDGNYCLDTSYSFTIRVDQVD